MKKNTFVYLIKKLRTPLFLAALFLSLFGSYQVYHGQYQSLGKEIMVIIYSTFQLFAFVPTESVLKESPLSYEIATWLAPTFTMVGFFSVFENIFGYFRQSLHHLGKKHIVLLGDTGDCLEFIKNFQKEEPKVGIYFLCDFSDTIDEKKYQSLMAKVIRIDFSLRDLGLNKMIARDHSLGDYGTIISFEGEPKSYGRVFALSKLLEGQPHEIDFFLQTTSQHMKEIMEAKMDQIQTFDLHFFQKNELIIKSLLDEGGFQFSDPRPLSGQWDMESIKTMEDLSQGIGRYHLLFVGFSKMAEMLLIQASNLLTINVHQPLRVTIVDRDIMEKWKSFQAYRPMVHKVFQVDFIEGDYGSKENLEAIEALREEDISGVFFLDQSVNRNIFNVDLYREFLEGVPIGIYTGDQVEIGPVIESLSLRLNEITAFGEVSNVLTKSVIMEERLWDKAKKFNGAYNQTLYELMGWEREEASIQAQWMELSNVKKESSIYQSAHRTTKIKLLEKIGQASSLSLGEVLEDWNQRLDKMPVADQVKVMEEDLFMNYMAALEHKRWNNFYYMRGFSLGPVKDEARKKHDCLIDDWSEFLSGKQRDKAIYDMISVLSVGEEKEALE